MAAGGGRGRAYALFALTVLCSACGNLSQTAVNSMMTPIVADFGIGVELGQWLTTAYMLAIGIVVPITTFFVRRLSPKGYMALSLAFFMAGALCSALSVGFWMLLAGRLMQAISAGLLLPYSQNIAMESFLPGKQATAMGISGIAMGFAPNIGPSVGGLFIAYASWRGFFWMLAIAGVAFAIAAFCLVRPGAARDASARLDWASFAVSTIAFGGLLAGLSNASQYGATSALTWAPAALGLLFLAIFIRREKRVEDPLIDMRIFRSRKFAIGFAGQSLLFGSFMGITLVIPLYVEGVLGGSATDAGLVLLPAAILALFCNPLSGALGDKIGQEKVICGAVAIMTVGALLSLGFDEGTPLAYAAFVQSIRGFGISSTISCIVTWSLSDLEGPLISHGSSFCTLARQACASLGTTLMVFCIEALPFAGSALAYKCAFGVSAVASAALLILCLAKVRKGA